MTSPETSSLTLPGSLPTLVLAVPLTHGATPTRCCQSPAALHCGCGCGCYLSFTVCMSLSLPAFQYLLPQPLSPERAHTALGHRCADLPGGPSRSPQLLIQAQLLLSLSPHRLALLPDYSPVRPRHTEHRPAAHTLSTVTRLGNDLDNGQQRLETLLLMA